MAILDRSKKPYIEDRDELVSIGIDLPFHKSEGVEGWFKSTNQTIDAVKQNIRMLMMTKKGERLMQPNLGLGLDRFLFEQITGDTILAIQDEIISVFKSWLPFVVIKDIQVNTDETQSSVGKNTLNIFIEFNLNKDPNTLESVSVVIGE